MIFCYNLDNNGGEVMYVLGICDAGEILETFSIVNTIVLIIKITYVIYHIRFIIVVNVLKHF